MVESILRDLRGGIRDAGDLGGILCQSVLDNIEPIVILMGSGMLELSATQPDAPLRPVAPQSFHLDIAGLVLASRFQIVALMRLGHPPNLPTESFLLLADNVDGCLAELDEPILIRVILRGLTGQIGSR